MMINQEPLLSEKKIDKLNIRVFETSAFLGNAAANLAADRLENIIAKRGQANLILATGASQLEFLKYLSQINQLAWSNITVFHLDEYVGLREDHPASFRKYLHDHIIDIVQPGEFYSLQGDVEEVEAEVKRYQRLLEAHPIDVACVGIGENGHLAFNDPPAADFEDPKLVKVVELDHRSRQQQVDEGWFDNLKEVPTQALTLTVPAIMKSEIISCVVPDKRKAEAVHNTLYGPITSACPASILRTHQDTTLFLDTRSASCL